MVRVYVDLASIPSNVKCVNPQVSESTQIQSRIINKTYESRLDFLTIQLQSSRDPAILGTSINLVEKCTITNTHMTASRLTTIQTRIIQINQIKMKSTHETHQIQSSSHMHIMRNQIRTSRQAYIQIHVYQVCTHIFQHVYTCDSQETGSANYSNTKYFEIYTYYSKPTKNVQGSCARYYIVTRNPHSQ